MAFWISTKPFSFGFGNITGEEVALSSENYLREYIAEIALWLGPSSYTEAPNSVTIGNILCSCEYKSINLNVPFLSIIILSDIECWCWGSLQKLGTVYEPYDPQWAHLLWACIFIEWAWMFLLWIQICLVYPLFLSDANISHNLIFVHINALIKAVVVQLSHSIFLHISMLYCHSCCIQD